MCIANIFKNGQNPTKIDKIGKVGKIQISKFRHKMGKISHYALQIFRKIRHLWRKRLMDRDHWWLWSEPLVIVTRQRKLATAGPREDQGKTKQRGAQGWEAMMLENDKRKIKTTSSFIHEKSRGCLLLPYQKNYRLAWALIKKLAYFWSAQKSNSFWKVLWDYFDYLGLNKYIYWWLLKVFGDFLKVFVTIESLWWYFECFWINLWVFWSNFGTLNSSKYFGDFLGCFRF